MGLGDAGLQCPGARLQGEVPVFRCADVRWVRGSRWSGDDRLACTAGLSMARPEADCHVRHLIPRDRPMGGGSRLGAEPAAHAGSEERDGIVANGGHCRWRAPGCASVRHRCGGAFVCFVALPRHLLSAGGVLVRLLSALHIHDDSGQLLLPVGLGTGDLGACPIQSWHEELRKVEAGDESLEQTAWRAGAVQAQPASRQPLLADQGLLGRPRLLTTGFHRYRMARHHARGLHA
mmetsp:Transcript_105514/g.305160  ORF Transcript_105514/g.305160 Transcript_105514/m.305160 type:complete len:234 (+) Transcript_105514:408-1109(+)